MLTISGSSGSGISGILSVDPTVVCSGGSGLSAEADEENDCSVVEVTGGSTVEEDSGLLDEDSVEEDSQDSTLPDEDSVEDDSKDSLLLDENTEIFAVEVVEETSLFFAETELVRSSSFVDRIEDSLFDDDCGTLCGTLSELCVSAEVWTNVSDKAGSVADPISADAEELDCGSGEF